ncbi:MAG: hypothetical protein AB9869_17855 [Verrucomicrobiia bacterium]
MTPLLSFSLTHGAMNSARSASEPAQRASTRWALVLALFLGISLPVNAKLIFGKNLAAVAGDYIWKDPTSPSHIKKISLQSAGTFTFEEENGENGQRRLLIGELEFSTALTISGEKFFLYNLRRDTEIVDTITFQEDFSPLDPKKAYFLKYERLKGKMTQVKYVRVVQEL